MDAASADPSMFSSFPQLAVIGALAALVGAFWEHIKSFIQSISRIVFLEITLSGPGSKAVPCLLNNKGKRFTLGTRSFVSFNEYVNLTARRQTVIAENFEDNETLYFYKGVPFFLSGDGHNHTKLVTIRGLVDPKEFSTEAINFFNQMKLRVNEVTSQGEHNTRFRVYRKHGKGSIHARNSVMMHSGGNDEVAAPSSSGRAVVENSDLMEGTILGIYKLLGIEIEHLGGLAGKKPLLDILSFPSEVNGLLEEIDIWLKAEDWFRNRSIPWRMGTLFVGPPGTGKTTLVTGIAQRHDMPIFSLDISTMSNEEFEEAFSDAASSTPSMVLIEDIDRVFHGDKNITEEQGGGLTLDSILNTIAGAKPADGVFTAITANDPSHVSPAIAQLGEDGRVSRPGRVDRIIELGLMSQSCREVCAARILDFKSEEFRDEIVDKGEGDTAAQFTDRCVTLAREAIKEDPTILQT